MKLYFTILLLICSIFLNVSEAEAQSVQSKDYLQFASKFVSAVNSKKSNKVFKMIAKSYRKKYKGSKKELLNEFFAGKIVNSGEFSTIPFDKIYSIRIVDVQQAQPGVSIYNFITETSEGQVRNSLYLKASNKKLGFEPFRN